MKKNILIILILASVMLLVSCDYNDLGNMRRFNMGYAGDYAVEEAQEATKNLVGIFDGLTMPSESEYKNNTSEGKAKIEKLRAKMAAVSKAVEDIKNSKDVESEMKSLLNIRVQNTGDVRSNSNHFNLKSYITAMTSANDTTAVASTIFRFMLHVETPVGEDPFTEVQNKTGIYPDFSLTSSFNSLLSLAAVGYEAYNYKADNSAPKSRFQEFLDNLSSGEQGDNEQLKKIGREATEKLSNYIIRPMAQRYNSGYLCFKDYVFTALFADFVYTFYDLMTDTSVPMDEKIFKTDGASRIISYIGTIEYIYDVDFGIVDIINSMVED